MAATVTDLPDPRLRALVAQAVRREMRDLDARLGDLAAVLMVVAAGLDELRATVGDMLAGELRIGDRLDAQLDLIKIALTVAGVEGAGGKTASVAETCHQSGVSHG